MRALPLVLAVALAGACNTPRPRDPPRVPIDVVLASGALGHAQRLRVLLPTDYARSGARYPVLYLLHGMYGDHTNFTQLTRLVALTARLPLIVVMPEANDAWYAKGYERWVASDVVTYVDATYRTIAERRGRALAGLSMGGYGAFKLALKHPSLFAFAGSMSGAFDGPRGLEAQFPAFAGELAEAFGAPDNPARADEDVLELIPRARELPALYLDCGSADPLLASSRAVAHALAARGAAYEYHELPGAHSWEYWDAQLPSLLRAVMIAVTPEPNYDHGHYPRRPVQEPAQYPLGGP